MKKCVYCGREYPDEASVCGVDGHALKPAQAAQSVPSPFPATDRQQVVDSEHIRLLAIFHFVVAGLTLLGIAFLFLHYLLMSTMFSNAEMWKSAKGMPPPKEFLALFVWFYVFFGAILITAGVLNLLSGMFLQQRKHRVFSLVVGGLNCLQIPFGTILGVFTIIVLSRDSVRSSYSD